MCEQNTWLRGSPAFRFNLLWFTFKPKKPSVSKSKAFKQKKNRIFRRAMESPSWHKSGTLCEGILGLAIQSFSSFQLRSVHVLDKNLDTKETLSKSFHKEASYKLLFLANSM